MKPGPVHVGTPAPGLGCLRYIWYGAYALMGLQTLFMLADGKPLVAVVLALGFLVGLGEIAWWLVRKFYRQGPKLTPLGMPAKVKTVRLVVPPVAPTTKLER